MLVSIKTHNILNIQHCHEFVSLQRLTAPFQCFSGSHTEQGIPFYDIKGGNSRTFFIVKGPCISRHAKSDRCISEDLADSFPPNICSFTNRFSLLVNQYSFLWSRNCVRNTAHCNQVISTQVGRSLQLAKPLLAIFGSW